MLHLLAILVLVACGGRRMSHMPATGAPIGDALSSLVSLGVPITTSRQWTTAYAPRTGGGFDFICQGWNYGYDVPSEWIVMNLESGGYTITEGANQVYANSNFQIASENTLVTTTNQLRASNGRIFFPMSYGNIGTDLTDQHYVNVSYFDPADRGIHYLPSILDPGGVGGDRHAIVYSALFDHAGAYIYFGTQAVVGDLPFVFRLDPSTLAVDVIGPVGAAASSNVKYAYYLAKDEGPGAQWLYVAVGQDPYEIVKIDVSTGTQTVLLTTTGPGLQLVEFEQRADGWSANVYDNGVNTRYWIADGALSAYPGAGAPPGGSRTITPYSNALTTPPTIDWSHGFGEVLWRAYGATGAYTSRPYTSNHGGAISPESLITLEDSSVLGNGNQYNGFFRRSPGQSSATWYGAWPLGVSEPVLLSVSETLAYISGYPNGALYSYDPSAAWNPGTNPLSLGSYFASAGVKYSYFLQLGTNGRLYMAGRRERDSSGSGIGYYVPSGATYSGITAAPLDNYIPRGFVVLDSISRVVFSGETLDNSDAYLLVYDLNLNAITTRLVQAGIKNTGLLYATSNANIVLGLTNDAPYYVYRYNITTGSLLDIATLGAAVGASTQRSDGSVWVMVGNNLKKIDVETMAVTTISDLTDYASVTYLAWRGQTLYLVGASTTLYYATTRDLATGHLTP